MKLQNLFILVNTEGEYSDFAFSPHSSFLLTVHIISANKGNLISFNLVGSANLNLNHLPT